MARRVQGQERSANLTVRKPIINRPSPAPHVTVLVACTDVAARLALSSLALQGHFIYRPQLSHHLYTSTSKTPRP